MNKIDYSNSGLANKGRNGDTVMAHLQEGELIVPPVISDETRMQVLMEMQAAGIPIDEYMVGEGMSINPETGLPEFGFGKVFKKIKKVASVALPIAASLIPGISPLGVALAGGLGAKLGGGDWGDALKGAAISGLGSMVAPSLGKAFSSAFPETAGALGMGGGLAQGGTTVSNVPFGPSLPTAGQLPWQVPGYVNPGASTGGLSSIANAIPNVGSIMDKIGDNPLPWAAGAAQLLSSVMAPDPNAMQQQLLAEQRAKEAEQNQLWSGIYDSNNLNRSQTDQSQTDWSTYGQRGAQRFFNDVNPNYQYQG